FRPFGRGLPVHCIVSAGAKSAARSECASTLPWVEGKGAADDSRPTGPTLGGDRLEGFSEGAVARPWGKWHTSLKRQRGKNVRFSFRLVSASTLAAASGL